MSETPSKRRRKGREAFCPGADPMDFQPYKKGSWNYDYYLKDFLDGWKEAEDAWEPKEEIVTRITFLDGPFKGQTFKVDIENVAND